MRVPLVDMWESKPNEAKYNRKDERFFHFIVKPEDLHFYPDYEKEQSPNTGDDLGLILLKK